MKPKEFHDQIDHQRLVAALAAAEGKTTGKVYVYVSHRPVEDAIVRARRRFARLGLGHIHHHRNAVLIYLAPLTQKFAIVGDQAIHEKCGDAYWQRLAAQLSADLKAGDITAALLNAVSSLEATLAEHFPAKSRNRPS
jgi:uncharacterized membrane protein